MPSVTPRVDRDAPTVIERRPSRPNPLEKEVMRAIERAGFDRASVHERPTERPLG